MNKNLPIAAFCLLCFTSSAESNDTLPPKKSLLISTIGLKVGENFEKMTGSYWKKTYSGSLCAGGVFEILSGRFGAQAELTYKMIKYQVNTQPGNPYVKIEYCDFPILAEYNFYNTFWVQSGCQFSGLIFAKNYPATGDKTDYKRNFNQLNIAPVLGLEIRMTAGFAAGGRYVYGLTNNNKESVTKLHEQWNTRTLQLYLCYKFR